MRSRDIRTEAARPGAFAALAPFCLIVFLCYLLLGLSFGAIPIFVHDDLGFGATVVGWTIGAQSIVTVLTRGLAGELTDGKGARPAVVSGAAILTLAAGVTTLAGLSGLPPTGDLMLLLVGRLLLGLAESLVMTGALTGAIGAIGAASAGQAMVWVGIAVFVGVAAGAPAGGRLLSAAGMSCVGLASIVAALAALAMAVRVRRTRPVGGGRAPFLSVVGTIWPFGLGLGLSTVGYGALLSFLALDYQTKGWSGAGLAISAFSAGYVLARLAFGHFPDRFGGYRVIAVTLPTQAAGLVLLGLAASPPWALAGAAIAGAGYALNFPALGVEAVRRIPAQSRGAAMGAYVAFFDVGLGVTGPLGAILVTATGYPAIFLAGAALSIVALGVALAARPAAVAER